MATVTTDRRQSVNVGAAVKVPCRVATNANVTLSGLQTIDGVLLSEGDRVLVWQQTNPVDNGIYVASSSTWQRALDFDGYFDIVKGTWLRVVDGNSYAGRWFCVTSSNPITVGTSQILFSGSMNSDGSTSVTTSLSDFSIDQDTADGRYTVSETVAGGWNFAEGMMTVEFDWISNNYFTLNPNGHFATVLRCDTSILASAVRGVGVATGSFSGATEGPPYDRAAQIETYASGAVGRDPAQRYLIPGTETLPQYPIEDNTQYKYIVSSTVRKDGAKYTRYRLFRYNSDHLAWDLERDTGDALDLNPWIDATKTGIAWGQVFNEVGTTWSIAFTNVKVTWSAPSPLVTQVQSYIAYGAPDFVFQALGIR